MFVQEVFEVLYSPVKAFKKIIEKPDLKGVILVLVLVIAAMIVSQYVVASKLMLETRTPEMDDWTELLTNQHNWTSNGLPLLDDADYQMGNLDGNHSIISSASNETNIWLKLKDVETISCSETTQKELFFWIKWINEEESSPTRGTLKLFSGSEDSYFESDITPLLSSSGEWANVTLTVGSDQGWTSKNSSDWQRITGLEFKVVWSSAANLTMKIDGLIFRKFVSLVESGEFTALLPSIAIQAVLNISIDLLLWSAILLIVAKLFKEELGPLARLIVITGYSYIIAVIYTLASTVLISTFPTINAYLDPTIMQTVLNELWVPLPEYQIYLYLPFIGTIWIALLAAVIIRLMTKTTWRNALIITLVAFGIKIVLTPFLQLLLG